jgi:hypothetical protein
MGKIVRIVQSTTLLFVTVAAVSFVLHFAISPFSSGDSLALAQLLSLSISYKTDLFHISYLLTVSLVLALIGAIWLVIFAPRFRRFQCLQIAVIPLLALLVAGMLCRIAWEIRDYWVFYDMQPARLPSLQQVVRLGWLGAELGLAFAPAVVLYSFPWNVLWYGSAYFAIAIYSIAPQHLRCPREL